jgi:hypothetical protein
LWWPRGEYWRFLRANKDKEVEYRPVFVSKIANQAIPIGSTVKGKHFFFAWMLHFVIGCACAHEFVGPAALTASVRSVTPDAPDRAVSKPLTEDPVLPRLLLVVSPSPVLAEVLLVVSPALVLAVVLFAEDISAPTSSSHPLPLPHSNNNCCRLAMSACRRASCRCYFMLSPRLA